ncbi:hypothetical protein C8R47DRAFT_978113, partial [Mycena vitilis]
PSANIRRLTLDLASLAGVREAAAEVNTYAEPTHVLIHNAAASIGLFKVTSDGLESQIVTDHVGPFLFTKLLAPKLLASATASYTPRVVFVSSGAHAFGSGVNFDTVEHPNAETCTSSGAYFEAKSANILTAIELSKRSKGATNAYIHHPGGELDGRLKFLNGRNGYCESVTVIFTNINQKEESIPAMQALGILGPEGLPNKEAFQWKTIPQGAAT